MMSHEQQYFEQLRAADPGATVVDDMSALRARVMAGTTSDVVPFRAHSPRLRMWRYASAAAVVAVAAGLGYAGGLARQAPTAPTVPASDFAASGGLGGGAIDARVKGAGTAGSYVAGYAGGIILRPDPGLSNEAGTASAYRFNVDGIDLRGLLRQLVDVVGIADAVELPQPAATTPDLTVRSADGRQSASVDVSGGLANVNAYNDSRTPWVCAAAGSGAPAGTSPSTATVKPETKCTGRGPAPSDAEAARTVRAAFMRLGVDPNGTAQYDAVDIGMVGNTEASSVTVVVTPKVDGKPVPGLSWSATVSALGIFSLNAWVANVEPFASYPVSGAKDVAHRTLESRWSALGAQWVRTAAGSNGGLPSSDTTPPSPVMRAGKPTIDATVIEAKVDGVSEGLQMRWLTDGTAVLMPAWIYRDSAGDEWSMLAVSEAYINWTTQPVGADVRYAASTGAGTASAASGTATVGTPSPAR